MNNDTIRHIELETHQTKDISDGHVNGSLTVIWRDWDNHELELPKMVYITSVEPKEKKGPHLHTERNSFFTCIQGEVTFIIKDSKNIFHEIKLSETKPQLIFIPKGVPAAHINTGTITGKILALADISWLSLIHISEPTRPY